MIWLDDRAGSTFTVVNTTWGYQLYRDGKGKHRRRKEVGVMMLSLIAKKLYIIQSFFLARYTDARIDNKGLITLLSFANLSHNKNSYQYIFFSFFSLPIPFKIWIWQVLNTF